MAIWLAGSTPEAEAHTAAATRGTITRPYLPRPDAGAAFVKL